MKYLISKEKELNTYIVWEKHRNYMVEVYRGFKYECKKWLNARVNK